MTRELNNFFTALEKENPYDYFLIKKFHYNPKTIFNKTIDDIENKKYFDINIVYKYMFNNNFLRYLDIVFKNDDYISNLGYCVLESLNKLLKYSSELIRINLENDASYIDLYKLIRSRITHRVLYKDNKINEKMKNCDKELLEKVSRTMEINSKVQYSLVIRPKEEKEDILIRIENDDYEDDTNAVLFIHSYNSDVIINSLYCENRFLDIIENKLLKIDLENNIINNIIDILYASIKIKTKDYTYINGNLGKIMLSKKLIKEFNIDKATELIKLLELKKKNRKRDNKIIYLSAYKL